jgi:CRP-like cAMP-binding protein
MSGRLVEMIEEEVSFREYDPRQVVYFPDDPCEFVYWIHSGRVKVNRVGDQGRSLTFRHAVSGDILGEECLVEKRCYQDYAEALVPSVLGMVRSQAFRRLAREEVELCHAVAQALCRRTMDLEQVLADTIFVPVRRRIALGILRLYRQEDVPTDGTLNVTHQEVANIAGTTRETATGVLHGLREEGLLQLANRRIMVVDPTALERMATSL